MELMAVVVSNRLNLGTLAGVSRPVLTSAA